jgi:hypothetical protein
MWVGFVLGWYGWSMTNFNSSIHATPTFRRYCSKIGYKTGWWLTTLLSRSRTVTFRSRYLRRSIYFKETEITEPPECHCSHFNQMSRTKACRCAAYKCENSAWIIRRRSLSDKPVQCNIWRGRNGTCYYHHVNYDIAVALLVVFRIAVGCFPAPAHWWHKFSNKSALWTVQQIYYITWKRSFLQHKTLDDLFMLSFEQG